MYHMNNIRMTTTKNRKYISVAAAHPSKNILFQSKSLKLKSRLCVGGIMCDKDND